MNLNKLLKMQKELDHHIRKEKGLEGENLVPNTFVALQVELSEMANEHQWFKHWKADNEPRIICQKCHGTGLCHELGYADPMQPCGYCEGYPSNINPLLEEYVDSLHFFLSLAIQQGWEDVLYIHEEQLDVDEWEGGLSEWYLEMLYFINKSYFENPTEEFNEKWKRNFGFSAKQSWFSTAWIFFLNIGIHGFGFSLDQIEQAYLNKNKINHQRQQNGY